MSANLLFLKSEVIPFIIHRPLFSEECTLTQIFIAWFFYFQGDTVQFFGSVCKYCGRSPDMTSLTVLSPSRVVILNVHLVSNRRQLTGMSCCFNFCHTNMCHLSHCHNWHNELLFTRPKAFFLFEFCEKWWCSPLIIWFLLQTFKKYDSM